MSTSSDDQRPDDQRERAASAHLNPNDPAREAQAGTPAYGNFGKADDSDAGQPSASNDGSNDNPDEFSEFRKNAASHSDSHQPNGEPETPAESGPQRGHVTQNQDPHSVVAAKDADADVQRAAWSDDDPRYAGGKQKATWQENNDKEHHNN